MSRSAAAGVPLAKQLRFRNLLCVLIVIAVALASVPAASAQTLTISSITVSPGQFTGGSTQSGTGTVTLSGNAPGSTLVSIQADRGGLNFPGFVTVPAGSNSVQFAVSSNSVTAITVVTLTATYGGTATTQVTVVPYTATISIAPGSVTGKSTQTATGTVTLNVPTATAMSVALSVTAGPAVIPTSMTIPAGSTSGTFTASGNFVAQPTTVTVSTNNSNISPNPSTSFTVNPFQVSLSLMPGRMYTAERGTGTVTLNATSAGVTVGLSASSDPVGGAGLSLPTSVTVPNGSSSATFDFTGSFANRKATVTVTASYGGTGTAQVVMLANGNPNLGPGGCPFCEGQGGHPINFANGDVWITQGDYTLPGLGGGISLSRTWNSLWDNSAPIQQAGMFGDGWRSTYDERLQVLTGSNIRYWHADGSSWFFTYDSVSATWALTDPPDAHASLSFNSSTAKYTLTFVDGSQHIFNNSGYLLALIDRNGNQTTLTLDGNNRITKVTDAAGRWLQFNYNPNLFWQVASIQDATGVVANYTYATSGFSTQQLTKVTYADGSALNLTYDSSVQITSVTDSNGAVLESHTYDASRRGLTSQRANNVDKVTISYINNSLTRVTDSLGNVTDYNLQAVGVRWLVKSLSGSGCASCGGRGDKGFAYDAGANRTSSTDALNRTTTYTYDNLGDMLSKSVPLNGNPVTWSYTYNGFGEALTATDPLGHVTTNAYDAHGNLLTTTTPSPDGTAPGSTTSFAYDVKGQLTTITDPLGHVTTLAYTAAGLVDHVTDAQSHVTQYQYDARGNRTAVTDALGNQTTFAYDLMNRLTQITYPTAPATTTSFTYDTRGRRTSVTDQNGKVTTYAYDDADRLTSVTDAATNVTSYAYDTENNLTSITDALGRATSFAYDNFGRVTRTTFPSTLTETYTYDAVGNLLSKTDRKGQAINYFYDTLDRLSTKSYPDSTAVNYTYDNVSRLTQVQDPSGTYGFTFDNMGRLTGTSTQYAFLTAPAFSMAYGYDAASNRTSMTDPQSGVTTYVYDTLNRLSSLTNPQSQQFSFSYDALSRRTQMTRPNGVNTSYTYDSVSRLLSVLHQAGGVTVDGASYTVDAAGNRTSKTNQQNGVSENYAYDAIYQLTQVVQGANTTESYSYDQVGNRLSSLGASPYSYNTSNELTAEPGVSYTYDNNGNTLTKTDSTGTTSYAWDFENRLVSVTLPGTGGTVTFKYDPFGRRIQKSGPSGTTNYLYDGANIVEEVDGTGTVLARYTQGAGIDEPLAMLRGGATSYYQADGLGSITSVRDAAGAVAASYTYDAFGNLAASTGTLTNPFRYTGREFDADTGLYYYRARYYDPSVGRFVSEDPLDFGAGKNFFVYVLNSPTNLTDASGEDPALDANISILLNIFTGSQLINAPTGQYILIHRPCFEVMRILQAQGFETGIFPPFNNPKDHPGGWEFRTRGPGPGFHFRMPYPSDPTDPNGSSPFSPCPGKNCTLDQFHIDIHNPLGGDWWEHFKDFLHGR